MAYLTRIYDPQEGLIVISNAINKFDINRFLYAVKYKNYDEKKIELMSKQVSEYLLKLEQEHVRLLKFAETYNKKFVTDNNQCFNTALKLLRRLRNGVSEVKRIYLDFCPRWNSKHNPYDVTCTRKYSAFDYSFFSKDVVQLCIFNFDTYPPCVQGLYNELSKFFYQLNLSLSLCFKVLQDENRIRKDAGYCKYLYDEFKKKMLDEIWGIVTMIPLNHEDLSPHNNPAIASREQYSSTETWAPHGFHNYSVTDVRKLIIKEVIKEEKENNLTKEEISLFGQNIEYIHTIRNIAQHFDELMPEGYSREKLDAKIIAMFMRWCGITKEGHFITYFNKQYLSNPKHRYNTVQKNAVNNAKNKLLTSDINNTQYNDFVEKLNRLHFLPSTLNNKVI